ncbi:hypothetical protein Tco_1451463, partial [Tanacetum coccineum]
LGHSNSTVDDGQRVVGLVGNNVDEKLGLSIELTLVSQALKANFVQSLKGYREYHVSETTT